MNDARLWSRTTGSARKPEHNLIAIVDDEDSVRRAMERLVRAAGYAVSTYASGADFLQSLRSTRPDCILLDLHMGEVSGFDVLEALGKQPQRIPVVVVTADCTVATAAKTVALGASACLTKPVEAAVLLDALSAAIQLERSRSAAD